MLSTEISSARRGRKESAGRGRRDSAKSARGDGVEQDCTTERTPPRAADHEEDEGSGARIAREPAQTPRAVGHDQGRPKNEHPDAL